MDWDNDINVKSILMYTVQYTRTTESDDRNFQNCQASVRLVWQFRYPEDKKKSLQPRLPASGVVLGTPVW